MTQVFRRRLLPLAALVLVAAVLAGCGGMPPEGFPALSVIGDRIYLSHGANLYAVDLNNPANQLWKHAATNGAVYSPLAQGEAGLYAGTFTGQAIILDPQTGAVKTSASVVDQVVTQPVLENDRVYYAATNFLRTLDPASLAEQAHFQATRNILAKPLFISDTLYVASLDHNLYALDPDTLQPRWQVKVGGAIADTPAHIDTRLIFGAFDERVHVVDLQQQQLIWSSDPTAGWIWGMPAVSPDGTIFVGSLADSASAAGHVYALKPPSTQPLWDFTADDDVRAGPLLHNDVLYVVSQGGTVFALDPASGRELWRAQVDSVDNRRPALLGTPVIANEILYVAPSGGSTLIYGFPLTGDNHQPTFRFVPQG